MKREDAEKICRQLGNDPAEILSGFKAFADQESLDQMMSELPPVEPNLGAVDDGAKDKAVKSDLDELAARLKAIVENEETSKEDKKTAEDLIARLDEVKAAIKNAEDFLKGKEKAPVAEESTPEAVPPTAVPPEVPAA